MQPSTTVNLRRFPNNRWLYAAWRKGIRTRFKCPSCGGRAFERSAYGAGGLCHGNDAGDGRQGCRFSWPERDDYKHFYVEGA